MKQVSATIVHKSTPLPESHLSHGREILCIQLIWLSCPEISREAKPGQFVMVNCGEECTIPRPFSIHQVDEKGDIALLFAVWEGGKGTSWLSQQKVGDNIDLFGPLGNGYSIHPDSHNLLLLAAGIGIAPLHFLAQEAINQGKTLRILLGVSKRTHLPQTSPLPSDAELIIMTEDGAVGRRGKITDFLPDFANRADQIFICGPREMYEAMALKKQELKLEGKPVQVSLEVRMGCGRGVCYGCTVKTNGGLKQVCTDGPVFDLDDVLWDEPDFLTGV